MSRRTHPQLDALIEVSARLGSNPLLVQANSGNTSLKIDGILWIKASGKWLARAGQEEILVSVDLAEFGASIQARPDCVPYSKFRDQRLMPSIETAMHAVIPAAATLHVHSVNAIAWAVQDDGADLLAERLDGLRWQWIPYVASGMPLAREVERALARDPDTEIFVLGNHGVVVCGEDPLAAEALLAELEERVAIEPRRHPKPDWTLLARIAGGSAWRACECEVGHALSTDAISRTIFMEGILYPCQAMFLGPAAPILPAGMPVAEGVKRYEDEYGVRPRFFLVEGYGVVMHESITAAERENLAGLAEVLQRIDVSAGLRYLTDAEIANVMSAEAYRYRGQSEYRPDLAEAS